MSFFFEAEQEALNHVELTTTILGAPITAQSPGVAEVRGDGIPRIWTTQQGFGLAGAIQRFTGQGLAEFDITLTVWEREHRFLYEVWAPLVAPVPVGVPERVFQIKYPTLAMVGITKCVFLNTPIPIENRNEGTVSLVYKCRQWRKPLPTLATPAAPGADTPGGPAQSAFAQAANERIAANNDAIAGLAGQL